MKNLTLLQRAIGIGSIIAALSACNGAATPFVGSHGQTLTTAAAVRTPAHRRAHGPLVYVSDNLGNFIDVFGKDGTLLRKITTGLDYPAGLFVDAKHNLWVANDGGGNVLKFKRGAMKAAATYGASIGAWGVTKCRNEALYVADLSDTIDIFARGHHMPTGSLQENSGGADSVECDSKGNVFVTATVFSPPGYVIEFPSGKNKPRVLPLYLANPVDAKPDPAGNLLIVNSAGGPYNTVTEYTESGSPTGKSMPTGANWTQIAITANGNAVFGADANDLEGVLMAFPSGKMLQTYADRDFRQLGGIAYDPG
ncbi:MAG TPA: hypothetical protein VFE16_07195 [Candidatus Cybelea sp.]|jgi:DNA-binding beta-propeller fold protein YncE|nr:hypothetical protein [Candidatus Cybelea sp.]